LSQELKPAQEPSETSGMTGRRAEWSDYANTILEFQTADGCRVDLRSPVPPSTVARLAQLGLGAEFAVVTPWNPRGIPTPDTLNKARLERMRSDLEKSGCRLVPADGVSPDGAHREPGFAVSLPLKESVALAHVWEQAGLFWFDGTAFWLVPAFSADPA